MSNVTLKLESSNYEKYLAETELVNFSHRIIQEKVQELFSDDQNEIDKVKVAFEFVRDQISHSWDIQSSRITCVASDVLQYQEGICYAKSHLLATLLRSQNIPTGFCYQRLMLFDTPEQGYCIHALNAVYIAKVDRWIRLDVRGNKSGMNAQFSLEKEQLAFRIDSRLGEVDYSTIYINPHPKTIHVLKQNKNAIDMCRHHLPEYL